MALQNQQLYNSMKAVEAAKPPLQIHLQMVINSDQILYHRKALISAVPLLWPLLYLDCSLIPKPLPLLPSGKPSLTARNLSSLGDDFQKARDVKAEVLDGIKEMLDELDQVDDQIAEKALEHIHSNEIILTHTSSMTVQKFLLTAARKRKFTVIHVEAYPNEHQDTHATIMTGRKAGSDDDADLDPRFKSLTAAGITVILIPDSAVFAIMSRVNKVILGTHSVLANGGLVAAVGARAIASAAKAHKTPVVVLSGVYKLSPVYPFDTDELIEHGDASRVIPFEDGEFVEKIEVMNPLFDYVPADLVDLYITNL
jgi:translation initiation factor eIF-2B subunit beta